MEVSVTTIAPTFLPVLLPTPKPIIIQHGAQVGPLLPYLLAVFFCSGVVLSVVLCKMAGCCCFDQPSLEPLSPRGDLTPRARHVAALQSPLLAAVDAGPLVQESWDGGTLGEDETRGRSVGPRGRAVGPPVGRAPDRSNPTSPARSPDAGPERNDRPVTERSAAVLGQPSQALSQQGSQSRARSEEPLQRTTSVGAESAGPSEAAASQAPPQAGKSKMTIEEALLDEIKPGSVGFLDEGFTEATSANWKQWRGSGDEVVTGSVDDMTNRRRENMSWRLWWRAQAARSKQVIDHSPMVPEEIDMQVFTDVPPGPPAEGFVYVALPTRLLDSVRLLLAV